MDTDKALTYINDLWAESVESTIAEYISIPNQSPLFDPDWATNGYQDQAVDLLVDWVKKQKVEGLTVEVVRLEGRTPVILCEVPDTAGKGETVLLYGHMDKQPPLTEDWDEGLHPHTPVFRDGKLYGRGGADDGYAVFAAVAALEAMHRQGVPHARAVVLIEACEESGSFDLPFYIDHLKARIATPSLVICLDSGCGNYEQLWLTSSLRGVAVGTLDVHILKEGCHSGKSSGIVPDSFRIIRQLLTRVEDETNGKVLGDAFYGDIPEHRVAQAKRAAEVLGSGITDEFPFVDGAHASADDLLELILNRYTGIAGIPDLAHAGALDLPIFSCVLIHQAILEKDPPYGAQVTYTAEKAGSGWESPKLADWLEECVAEASSKVFKKEHCYTGEGIPFMGMLGKKFPEAQFVITGVLGPASNAHGPNEFLHLDMSKKLTACVSYILGKQAE